MSNKTGQELKAEGIEQIQRRSWHPKALALLEADIRAWTPNETHASDAVRNRIGYVMGFDSAPHPNSWGALLAAAARSGLIERVGFEPSMLPASRGRIVSVWRRASVIDRTSQEKPNSP